MYADNIVINSSEANPNNALTEVFIATDNIKIWCKINKLTINENETKFTTFLRKPTKIKHRFTCKNIPLERTPSYKYLGTDIGNTLTMETFNKNVCTKVNYKVYMFGRVRNYKTTQASIMIYKQMILLYFDLG